MDRRKDARKKGAGGRESQEGKRKGEEIRGINGLIDQQKDNLVVSTKLKM